MKQRGLTPELNDHGQRQDGLKFSLNVHRCPWFVPVFWLDVSCMYFLLIRLGLLGEPLEIVPELVSIASRSVLADERCKNLPATAQGITLTVSNEIRWQ